MRSAERVVNVKFVAKIGQSLGEGGVVSLFFRLEPQVFQKSHVAIAHIGDDFAWDVADRVMTETNRMVNQVVQMIADGSQ